MINLDDLQEIKKLDPGNVYGSTEMLPLQCRQIWQNGKISYQRKENEVNNIILCGMGGSAYGGYVANSLFKYDLKIPLYSNNDYHLPKFANDKSLIVLSSYSGNTEEIISCAKEAYEKNFKVTGITTGGILAEIFRENNSPHITINPKYNPSGQPRLGTGYMILGFISILNSAGLLNISDSEISGSIRELEHFKPVIKSDAILASEKLVESIPLIFVSEFLSGNGHILRNQFNETAKTFSAFEDIPELNHHLMEGLKYPKDKKIKALFIYSNLYSEKIKKRTDLTRDIVSKNKIGAVEYHARGESKLSQMLNVLAFGGYVSLFLSLHYGEDPSLIPWVDYFKNKLGE